MSYIVKFGDNTLNDYCKVLNIKRSVLPERSNFSKQIPTMNGSYYTGSKYNEKQIQVEIAIVSKSKEDYMLKIDKLASILNTKRPTKLIISDEPHKIYYAVLDGSTQLEKKFQTGKVELNFICHDPLAYSTYWNTYNPDSKGLFSVESFGTADTFPIIDVDFKSKGCFFQLTNPKGETVLIGKPKDLTKSSISESDIVLEDNCQSSTTMTSIADSLLDSNRFITGNYGVGLDGGAIICTNFGTSQENKWTGAGFKRNLGENVENYEVTVDVVFSSQGKNYTPPQSSLGTYKVVNCGGLWINKEPNIDYPVYAMSPNTLVYPVEIKNGWAKHTHSNNWNTFTGWSSMNYLQKVSNTGKSSDINTFSEENAFADEQLGTLEIYGFDQNGTKLFKMEISDTSPYYEYASPKIFIGNKLVLHDNKNTPSARKETIEEKEVEVASGVFGDFNDFDGQFIIRKEKNSRGQTFWSCEVRKIVNGRTVIGLATESHLTNSSYPSGALNYIGIFMGRYGNNPETSVMAVKNIKVKRLNVKTDQVVEGNLEIFNTKDHMQIDFSSGLVTLNSRPILSKIDIGSQFFSIPTGTSQFIYRSDADATVICGFQDRFI